MSMDNKAIVDELRRGTRIRLVVHGVTLGLGSFVAADVGASEVVQALLFVFGAILVIAACWHRIRQLGSEVMQEARRQRE